MLIIINKKDKKKLFSGQFVYLKKLKYSYLSYKQI